MSGKKSRKKAVEDPNSRHISRNRKARYEYEILDDLECGIVLQGSEVKSIRNSGISLDEAYARMRNGELWLFGANINEYPQANFLNHETRRPRKLLLHRRELQKFAARAEQQGLTLIPLDVYLKSGRIKVRIGLARGRRVHDKRQKLRKDTDRREIRGAMMKRG